MAGLASGGMGIGAGGALADTGMDIGMATGMAIVMDTDMGIVTAIMPGEGQVMSPGTGQATGLLIAIFIETVLMA